MNKGILILALAWVISVVSGTGVLLVYEFHSGPDAAIPDRWPAQSAIPLAADAPTLLLFAHPGCPCTEASVGELADLMTQCQGELHARVVFLDPKGMDSAWLHSDLWRSAAQIPGVAVTADEDGVETRRFQATTSGQVVLYAPDGRLLFRGGITASRGHYGDNQGLSELVGLLRHETSVAVKTPVFGCSLLDPGDDTRKNP